MAPFLAGGRQKTTEEAVLHSFDRVDGAPLPVIRQFHIEGEPGDGNDGLDNIFIANGRIFGMTKYGGSDKGSSNYQNGVVFSLPLPD